MHTYIHLLATDLVAPFISSLSLDLHTIYVHKNRSIINPSKLYMRIMGCILNPIYNKKHSYDPLPTCSLGS